MTMIERLPSLETRHLHHHAPWILQPTVVYSSYWDVAGMYIPPTRGECAIGSKFISSDAGIIVLNPIYHEGLAATTAHEWRHHWQYSHGYKFQDVDWFKLSKKYSYWLAIKKFFLASITEMDALLFEHRLELDEKSEMRLAYIYGRAEYPGGLL